VKSWLEYRGEQYVQIELPTGAWPTAGEDKPHSNEIG
jgi:hypothetical protein